MDNIIDINYKLYFKGIKPKPIKLQIPGWAGDSHEHSNGCKPQPWHCVPFVEGSTYGLELVYPFDTECIVYTENNTTIFEGDFSKECVWSKDKKPPFSAFAPGHYGMTSSLNLKIPKDYIIRLESHPRFYTDNTNTVPIVVPGHIQSWWPRIFFIVFKTPPEGHKHIFRKGEPYGQMLILPQKVQYNINPMSYEDEMENMILEKNILDYSDKLSKNKWKDYKGNVFDDKYKQMAIYYNKNKTVDMCKILDKSVKIKNKLIK